MPSCATLASSALRRCFIEVRSWRCHTQRTPAGEVDKPGLLRASQTPAGPPAGRASPRARPLAPGRPRDPRRHRRFLDLDRRAVLQDRLAAADLLQRQLAAFIVQLLEPVEAVPAIPH